MAKHEIVQILDRTFAPGGPLPQRLDNRQARVLLIGISGQEADLRYRKQIGGPANGLWQFEKGGGVAGVLRHPASAPLMREACSRLGVPFDVDAVYRALPTNDVLACAAARCLLYTDPHPLPLYGEAWPSWDYYVRNWRPGKPHPNNWLRNYQRALDIMREASA